ncbi:cation/H(+) antiporter 15-like [Trifolium pratense]|uniref:cation/H(+) antiporter 15-like n=1 Tax=Trifolium pratense TaxID=57577 RepID=UPI001E693D43|nr:cation/H(+) antiporter 15-like [Trifolium pratense]
MAEDGMSILACYNATFSATNDIWMTDDVIAKRVPLLCLQIAYDLLVSRFFYFILKRIRVPLIVAQILAGFSLSPTLLGNFKPIFDLFYEQQGILAIETFSNLGILYYVFLSGLEMNSDVILRSRKKGTSLAVVGIVTSMLFGVGLLTVQHKLEDENDTFSLTPKENHNEAYLFWSLALSVTGFPVLARILAKLKLLYTKLGKDALTAAMLTDAYGWVLFTLLIPYSKIGGKPFLSVISTLLFIVFCFTVVRPILTPIVEKKTSANTWRKSQLLDLLMGVFICSFITDCLGTHPIVGAFVFGLILPHGKFADMVMEMSDDFVSGILCPVYFAGFGFRLNLPFLLKQQSAGLMMLIVVLLCIPKVLSSLIVTFFFGMPARDGLAIGLLLNTKGVMAIILLNVAWDKRILDPYCFMVMMLAIILMTVIVSPLISAIYQPKFRFMQSQLKTMQKLRFDMELRVVACVHNTKHANSMIHVLEATNATRVSPIHVSVAHLVELTRHGTAILVSQMDRSDSTVGTETTNYGSQSKFESITNAFEEFVKQYNAVRIDTSNVVSSYTTIHEDIFNVAEEKRASLILLPFHKEYSTIEGGLEIINNQHCEINKNVLQQAPCSVGIFVDRGLGSLLKTKMRIVMIFIGGPDDREALSIAWRMAGHSGTQLHVLRIHLLDKAAEEKLSKTKKIKSHHGILSTVMDSVMQNELDEKYLISFRHKAVNNNDSIVYSEKEVHSNTGEEIPTLLNEIDKSGYDLYIVGQGSGKNTKIFSKLLEWCDHPELGVIGDILASTSFGSQSSVLIVQQYMIGRKTVVKQSHRESMKTGPEIL